MLTAIHDSIDAAAEAREWCDALVDSHPPMGPIGSLTLAHGGSDIAYISWSLASPWC